MSDLTRAAATLLLSVPLLATPAADPAERARAWAANWLQSLPSFVCRQSTNLFDGSHEHRWRPVDDNEAEIVIVAGLERYELLAPGARTESRRVVDLPELGSRGEFASALRALFDPASHTRFSPRARSGGLLRLDFQVPESSSQWFIGPGEGQPAAYSGSLWIEPSSGEVRRLEMTANRFPPRFPAREVRLRLVLAPVTLDRTRYLLPERAELRICSSGLHCQRKTLNFHDYRRFQASSTLLDAPAEPTPPPR